MDETSFIPYTNNKSYSIEEMKKRSQVFLEDIERRRTIRNFF